MVSDQIEQKFSYLGQLYTNKYRMLLPTNSVHDFFGSFFRKQSRRNIL